MSNELVTNLEIANIDQIVANSANMDDLLANLSVQLRSQFTAEAMVLYARSQPEAPLVCYYHSACTGALPLLELGPFTVAGYVAANNKALALADVYNPEALETIDSRVSYEFVVDQETGALTGAIAAVPLSYMGTVCGVLQLNRDLQQPPFDDEELVNLEMIGAELIAALQGKLVAAPGPFDHLVIQGNISASDLQRYQKQAQSFGVSVAHLLLDEARIPAAIVGQALEDFYNVLFIGFPSKLHADEALIQRLNAGFLDRNCWVPLRDENNVLRVLIDDPTDGERLLEINNLLPEFTQESLAVGIPEQIRLYLIYPSGSSHSAESGSSAAAAADGNVAEAGSDKGGTQLQVNVGGSVSQLVDRLIANAMRDGASDIHINAYAAPAPGVVRYRVDGVCRKVFEIAPVIYRSVVARIKVMANLDIAESRKPQDGKITTMVKGKELELRVATLPTVHGEGAVLRLLAAGEPLPMEKLNFSDYNLRVIRRALEHPHGIVLVVGPTGSGKTTTLHGLLNHLNTPERNVLTAEDPVEITQPGLVQVQIYNQVGLTFAAALRSFLRSDPDVILIGEMRDHETAHAGIEASLTGHLVFSTLHTNSAPETITRLLDIGLDPMNFADALVAVVAQRLVRTICPHCKKPYRASAEEIENLSTAYGKEQWQQLDLDLDNLMLYRGSGCSACGGTGYRGRTGIHECLEATTEMKKLITKRSAVSELRACAIAQGMPLLLQDGISKILKGQTDFSQLRRVAV